MPPAVPLPDAVKRWAHDAGFDLAGIAPVDLARLQELAHFPAFVDAGHAGEMDYLKARDEAGRLKRADLARVAPWARSVIVCAINYNTAAPYSTEYRDPKRGWISRYAWSGNDYHDSLITRLRRVEAALHEAAGADIQTRCYVDTGPLVERVYAKYAGIGWLGKNTCVINEGIGSWLFLGVILTSLELPPDLPAPDRCGTCTRCLDACPTNAFTAPYQMDASRCISYLTIEKRGSISEDLRPLVGNHLFGCDICQDVCPWNREAPAGRAQEFQPRPELVNPALDWVAHLTAEDFRRHFRGSAIKRAKLSGLRRNAIIAMANSGGFQAELEKLAHDEDETVAEHARQALGK